MNILLPLSWWISSWRDAIEIIFFSSVFYYISLWLQKDSQKNLLAYFYGFCALTFGAHSIGLPTINYCLLLFCPAIILLFMFMHQTTLQRNLVSLKNIVHPPQPVNDWLTILLRASLTMLHENKELSILIENTDSLSSYVHAEYTINAPLSKDLLTLTLEHIYNPQKTIWINSEGIIRGINVSWKNDWGSTISVESGSWLDDAMTYTSKNDALFLHINPLKQYCTIIQGGTLYQELTIEQATQVLRKKIHHPISVTKKGYAYDVSSKKNNMVQHTS